MTSYRFDVRISLHGPVLSQGSGSRDLGLDAAALRGVDGTPELPGNLIRGNLRHSWERFKGITGQDHWDPGYCLGTASPDKTGDRPDRGRLRFSAAWRAEAPVTADAVRHRISIDPKTGAVEPQALQVIDCPFGPGTTPVFRGTIEAELPDQAAADDLADRIRKGLEYAGSLGALKGIGFGRIAKVAVAVAEHQPVCQPVAGLEDSECIGIRLRLDRPFCIARPHAKNNRFESEELIPGGVVRGAMARRLFEDDCSDTCADGRFADLCAHFQRVRLSHGMPVCDGRAQRPLVLPLSLVEAPGRWGDDQLYDLATMAQGAGLINGRAPAFRVDWKEGSTATTEAARLCGTDAAIRRRIQVRTAIEAETGAAKETALFAMESIVPEGLQWLAAIDLTEVPSPERKAVADQLALLFAEPLTGIGKTKAEARIEPSPEPFPAAVGEGDPQGRGLLRDGIACVCLQADTLLLPDPYGLAGTGGSLELGRRYAQAWRQLSGGTLELIEKRWFARQHLVGGGYLHRRFWSQRGPYNPELMTDAGSVFVLRPTDSGSTGIQAAEDTLARWQRQGLDQVTAPREDEPDGVDEADLPRRRDWRQNPYIRQNGYGAVAINLALHWDLAPPKEAWHGLD